MRLTGTRKLLEPMVMVALGLALCAAGLYDLLLALRLTDRLLGAVIAATGGAVLGSGICLKREGWLTTLAPVLRLPVLLGSVGVALTCFAPQIVAPPAAWALSNYVAFGIGIAASYVAALIAVEFWRIPRRSTTWSLRTGLTTVGLSATFCLSLLEFWYSNLYEPTRAGPAINIALKLTESPRPPEAAGPRTFAADIALKNVSKSKVLVVASVYGVRGLTVAPPADTGEGFTRRLIRTPVADGTMVAHRLRRYADVQDVRLVDFGQVVPDNSWLEPSEEFAARLQITVPPEGPSEALQVFVQLIVAKSGRLQPTAKPDSGPHLVEPSGQTYTNSYLVWERRLRDVSLLRRALFGPRSLRIIQLLDAKAGTPIEVLDAHPLPGLIVCVDRAGALEALVERKIPPPEDHICHLDRRQRRLASFYGLVQARAMYEHVPGPP